MTHDQKKLLAAIKAIINLTQNDIDVVISFPAEGGETDHYTIYNGSNKWVLRPETGPITFAK